MTIAIFLYIFTIGSFVSSLLTEALKASFTNMASNVIALINAIVVGLLGTIAAYILMGVAWTPQNIVCLLLMVVCVFIGSTVGYDKVMQTIIQIKNPK